jgi:hypothetical protein
LILIRSSGPPVAIIEELAKTFPLDATEMAYQGHFARGLFGTFEKEPFEVNKDGNGRNIQGDA